MGFGHKTNIANRLLKKRIDLIIQEIQPLSPNPSIIPG